jgi:protein arginine kinase
MWYTKFGPSGDIVLSTRIRLARNFEGIPFGNKLSTDGIKEVTRKCASALPDLKLINLSSMTTAERNALKECHLISTELAQNHTNRSILINSDCTVSIMIGEEDHIRIQAMCNGFDLVSCIKIANEIDDKIEAQNSIAFSPQFGYLTCCPTNTGTGLRASIMVHLPALTQLGSIDSIIRSLSKLGLTVRGIYGEGSQALGDIYQVSNQVTLGTSEDESVSKLKQIIEELIVKERNASLEIYNNSKFAMEDKILRSKGLLQNSRIMTSNEAMQLLSNVRWGINLGIINDITHEQLLEALYASMPANITKSYNTTTSAERDLKRSEILSSAFSK